MKYFSETALETIARNELKEYDESLILGEPQAVPIEELVEYHFGLEIEYRHLRQNGDVLGCTVFNGTKLPIWIPEEKRYALLEVKGGTIVLDVSLLKCRNDDYCPCRTQPWVSYYPYLTKHRGRNYG